MSAQPHLYDAYVKVVAQLADQGVHAPSEWWHANRRTKWTHPTAKHCVSIVGRNGDKTRNLAFTAVTEISACRATPGRGERWWWVQASNRVDACRASMNLVAEYFSILGFKYTRADDRIELLDLPFGFLTIPCSNKAARGPRAIGGGLDELATWNVDGVNTAEDVANSIVAMAGVYPEAYFDYVTSPMGTSDYSATLYFRGDDEYQTVHHAPSWVANPNAITRDAAWRAARGDQKTFDREYAAIHQAGASLALDPEHVALAFERNAEDLEGDFSEPVLVLDPSNNAGNDNFTSCVAYWTTPTIEAAGLRHYRVRPPGADPSESVYLTDGLGGRYMIQPGEEWRLDPVLVIAAIEIHEPGLDSDTLCRHLAAKARAFGTRRVVSDQREMYALSGLLGNRGMDLEVATWTNQSKADGISYLRRLTRDRSLAIPPDLSIDHEIAALKDEIAHYGERITPSGNMVYGGQGRFKDDLVSLLITTAIADGQYGMLRGSPIGNPRRGYYKYINGMTIDTRRPSLT